MQGRGRAKDSWRKGAKGAFLHASFKRGRGLDDAAAFLHASTARHMNMEQDALRSLGQEEPERAMPPRGAGHPADEEEPGFLDDAAVERLLGLRDAARADGDYERSDAIRRQLALRRVFVLGGVGGDGALRWVRAGGWVAYSARDGCRAWSHKRRE